MKGYYEILRIPEDATDKDIKTAYRKLVMQYHPDKNLDNIEEAKNKFIEVDTAYKVLSNPNLRKQYDHGIEIDQAELKKCQEMARKIFNNGFFDENMETIINSFDNGDKKVVYHFISAFYDNEDEFFEDLKDKRVDKIVEKMNTGIKVYFKELNLFNIFYTFVKYLWYMVLYFLYSLLKKIEAS